mmetsp:Transcript_7199/g.10598  ORF Transcript_7199/g.10598 Transcript_7199/m.10598 type:complete len:140 (+) Transcript_7199:70-489(+)
MIFILWLLVWLFSILHPFTNAIILLIFFEFQDKTIQSIQFCDNINLMRKIELYSHIALQVVLVVFLKYTWLAILINAPLLGFHVYQMKNSLFYVSHHTFYKSRARVKKEAWIKIGVYVFYFFFYLYCFIRAVIAFEGSS